MRLPLRHALAAILCLALALPGVAAAQPEGTATASAKLNQSALRPGDEAVVAVVVDIAEGYHSQSDKPLDANLIPFVAKLDAHPAIAAAAPPHAKGPIEEYP